VATSFGKYFLQRKLAEGGMAEVFLAKQSGMEGFEKPVVVKRILPHLTSDPKFVDMFVNEGRVAARLSHPSIVTIFELGKVGDQYFIAMEYIHGENLRQLARQAEERHRRPPIALAARIIADTLGALHYAHTRTGDGGKPLGLVHRDISPQNVLVTYEGGIKLVDFGIAKATQDTSNQQTQAGLLKGKYAYMSPEQCRSRKIDARSDIFSAGILLWELVTWRRLFRRDSDLATLVAVADEAIPPLSSERPDVPPELERICMRALARQVNDRYPSAQAMQAELEALIRAQAWEADSIALQRYMGDLFADKLRAQDEAVRAAGVGTLDDLLISVEEGSHIAWMSDPKEESGRTPAAMPLGPLGGSLPPPPAPSLPPTSSYRSPSTAPVYLPSTSPVPSARETTPSTLRHAVGQKVPLRPLHRSQLSTGSMQALRRRRTWPRLLVVLGTSLLLAGAIVTAVMWPGQLVDEKTNTVESATVHLMLDEEAQIFLDGERQLPAKDAELMVSAHRPHEIKVKRGKLMRTVQVPALDVGVTHPVLVKLAAPQE
jgi:serine/threonine-protein kinase